MVVETANALRLAVVVVGRIGDVTVPKRVVGKEKTTFFHDWQYRLVGLDIVAFVAVDEGQVEVEIEFGSLGDGIANHKRDSVAIRRIFEPFSRKILHFIVDFVGPEVSTVGQSLGHAKCRIAAERAHFEHTLWSNHLHKHFQQSTLQMPTDHVAMQRVKVRGTPEFVQIFGFWLGMAENVVFQGVKELRS